MISSYRFLALEHYLKAIKVTQLWLSISNKLYSSTVGWRWKSQLIHTNRPFALWQTVMHLNWLASVHTKVGMYLKSSRAAVTTRSGRVKKGGMNSLSLRRSQGPLTGTARLVKGAVMSTDITLHSRSTWKSILTERCKWEPHQWACHIPAETPWVDLFICL